MTTRKQQPETNARLNWPCMRGEQLVAYVMIGGERYCLTAKQAERRKERLAREGKG